MSEKWTEKEKDEWMTRALSKKKVKIEEKACQCRVIQYQNAEGALITETDLCSLHRKEISSGP